MTTLESLLMEFHEVLYKKCGNLEITYGEIVDGNTEPLHSFISHTYQTAINEARLAFERAVPEEHGEADGYNREAVGHNDCRSQTISNIEEEYKKLCE